MGYATARLGILFKTAVFGICARLGSHAALGKWKVLSVTNDIIGGWQENSVYLQPKSLKLADFERYIINRYGFEPDFAESFRSADASSHAVVRIAHAIAPNLILLGIVDVGLPTTCADTDVDSETA